jgi:hypothetical protein
MGYMLGSSCASCCNSCFQLPDTIAITISAGDQGVDGFGTPVDVCACAGAGERTFVLQRTSENPCVFRHYRCASEGDDRVLPLVFQADFGTSASGFAKVSSPPGPITEIFITEPGNYAATERLKPPDTVAIAGQGPGLGGGAGSSGAVARFVWTEMPSAYGGLVAWELTSVSVESAGTGYSDGSTIAIYGIYSDGLLLDLFDGGVIYGTASSNNAGEIQSINIETGGLYWSPGTGLDFAAVHVTLGSAYGHQNNGYGAELEAVLNEAGEVESVTIVEGGEGYISCGGPPGSLIEYIFDPVQPFIRTQGLYPEFCDSGIVSATPPPGPDVPWFETPEELSGIVIVLEHGEYDPADVYSQDCCATECIQSRPCCYYGSSSAEGPFEFVECVTRLTELNYLCSAGCGPNLSNTYGRVISLNTDQTCEDCPESISVGRCCSTTGNCSISTESCCLGVWVEGETCEDYECPDLRDQCQTDEDCGDGYCREIVAVADFKLCYECRDDDDCASGETCSFGECV